jgi:two-component system nitrogen regulation sensor histidine kinase GlnL
MDSAAYPGLDLLATAVVLVDARRDIVYANPAAENLLESSARQLAGRNVTDAFRGADLLLAAIDYAWTHSCSFTEHDLALCLGEHGPVHLACTVTRVENEDLRGLTLEFRPIEQRLKLDREEQLLNQGRANRELIRNLAHEIKNPLGGIRGAAQLLSRELDRPQLGEYTQVIMQEADRLQALMDRLLTPHRLPQPRAFSIHEALERVKSLLLAETPEGIVIDRDYDVSLPPLTADAEQIIQALLNIARNAVQAMKGKGHILFRTRVARQMTLARRRHRHAVRIEIIDDGPGIPAAIRDKIFYPLVSGREGGTGLGLSIAQTFIAQHQGTIEFDSRPGRTCFTVHLPLGERPPLP